MLSPLCGLLFITVGLALLVTTVGLATINESAQVLGGASLVALGSIMIWVAFKHWLKWRRLLREEGDQSSGVR